VSVEPTDSVAHTIQRMVDENVGAIMVCEEGRIVGIFSECDVLRLAAVSSSFTSRQVDEVAGQPARPAIPITVSPPGSRRGFGVSRVQLAHVQNSPDGRDTVY